MIRNAGGNKEVTLEVDDAADDDAVVTDEFGAVRVDSGIVGVVELAESLIRFIAFPMFTPDDAIDAGVEFVDFVLAENSGTGGDGDGNARSTELTEEECGKSGNIINSSSSISFSIDLSPSSSSSSSCAGSGS
jgi:hypothetical protein